MIDGHIVVVDDGHVVPRLARVLAEAFGWTLSDRLRPDADLNYFATYTFWQHTDATLTAAWYSHWEEYSPGKTALWRRSAQFITYPLVTAPASATWLARAGRKDARFITPGVDKSVFKPTTGDRVTGRVGVAGLGSPRKWTQAVGRLAEDYDLSAVGMGWGIMATHVPHEKMPAWYNTLDVFVCTSNSEGVPMTVLEALACGCRVVLPTNVGIGPLIKEWSGVHTFASGDYDDLRRAIDQALKSRASRKKAAAKVPDLEAWVESHREALEL